MGAKMAAKQMVVRARTGEVADDAPAMESTRVNELARLAQDDG